MPSYGHPYTPSYTRPFERNRDEKESAVYWPYRTTPLVLPGAKVKKDAPLGECYLRHHPNPMVRAPPHHFDPVNPDVAMKQKVAESVLQRVLSPNDLPKVVHKQFNSPIGLYSEQNIADTLKCQASAIPKKPGTFDPTQSEAYKALIEEGYEDHGVQHISQPTRQGVFAPQQKARQTARPAPFRPRSPAINVTDSDGETIHQSNSFRRIMFSVLGETEY